MKNRNFKSTISVLIIGLFLSLAFGSCSNLDKKWTASELKKSTEYGSSWQYKDFVKAWGKPAKIEHCQATWNYPKANVTDNYGTPIGHVVIGFSRSSSDKYLPCEDYSNSKISDDDYGFVIEIYAQ